MWRRLALCIVVLIACAGIAPVAARPVVLTTTTSVNDTGLLDFVLPEFERRSGIEVRVIAVGSGQAIEIARRGDADLVLAHAPDLEREFVRQHHAAGHWRLMYNYFVLLGPTADPARVAAAPSAADAFRRIADARATFVSRGDQSGTHQRELQLWQAAKVKPGGDWYLESGSGMAATLRLADEKNAYALSDIGTHLARKSQLRLAAVYDRGRELLNPYSLLAVSPRAHPGVNYEGALRLVRYFLAPETQKRIASFGADRFGQPLFRVYERRRQR